MQVELSKAEIEILQGLLDEVAYIGACKVDGVDDLLDRFTDLMAEAEELEGIDLNYCGDACKL